MAERTVIIDGFSKSFAMTGWRLGYAVAPKHVVDAMDLLVLNTFTCVAEFTQVAAIEALRDSTHAVDAMVAEYRKRRDLFVNGLNTIPGFRCLSPGGAFYAWVNIEETGLPAEEVARLLLEEAGVAGIAGAAFGPCWEKLFAILAGQRTPPARRSAGAHAARVFALARGGGAVGQALLPVGYCDEKKLEIRRRKRKQTDKSVCPTKSLRGRAGR